MDCECGREMTSCLVHIPGEGSVCRRALVCFGCEPDASAAMRLERLEGCQALPMPEKAYKSGPQRTITSSAVPARRVPPQAPVPPRGKGAR